MKNLIWSSDFDENVAFRGGVQVESVRREAVVKRLTHAPELSIEFGVAEDEGRGSAVGAVVGVVDEVALFEEAEDFFLRQSLAGFDGGFAGHHRDQVVKQIPSRWLFGVVEIVGDIADELFEIDFFQHHGITGDQERVAAELFDAQAETVEHFGVFENQFGFFGAHFNGEWDEQLLRFY